MYKRTSRAMQHRHGVARPHPTNGGDVAPEADDVIASAGNMSFRDCAEEVRRLHAERATAENLLIAAKSAKDRQQIAALGNRIQSLVQRTSIMKNRQAQLNTEINRDSFKAAVKEIVPPDLLRRIFDRANELQADELAR